jgi:disulfide oxidoreductase YuzD
MLAVFLLRAALSGAAQNRAFIQQNSDQGRPSVANLGYRSINGNLRCGVQGSSTGTPCFANETNFATLFDAAQRESEQSATYRDLVERQRIRAAQEAAVRERTDGIAWYSSQPYEEVAVQSHANPEAADQSELLKNSKDRDFILRNFRTMYVDAHNAKYFGSDQMKAALGKNKDFWKLNIRIVDDRHVADVVLKVGYTFAWDFPFELTHQNTTIVLVSGKGEGPFSGPLGAADVARQFVNMAKPWREEKKKSDH